VSTRKWRKGRREERGREERGREERGERRDISDVRKSRDQR
jgi:hypothetical protein